MILRREDLAGHGRGRLHDEPADLLFELGEHPVAIPIGGFMGAQHNLFGGGSCFARLLRLDPGGRGARFVDQLLSLSVSLRQHFQRATFRSGPTPP